MAKLMLVSASIFLTMFLLGMFTPTACAQSKTKANCPSTCGGVEISYPFGVGEGCYRDKGFEITCNQTNPKDSSSSTPFLASTGYQVLSFFQDRVQVKSSLFATTCEGQPNNNSFMDLSNSPFTLNMANTFIAVGCNISARITDINTNENYTTGCVSICPQSNVSLNRSCSGSGCCNTNIPRGLKKFSLRIDSLNARTSASNGSLGCSYVDIQYRNTSFVNATDVTSTVTARREDMDRRVLLAWSIGTQMCIFAQLNSTSYACRANSDCVDSTNGPGYYCKCHRGYTGNAYSPSGCLDLNECLTPRICSKGARCVNTPGSYVCANKSSAILIIIGVAIGVGLLMITSAVGFWLFRMMKKRRDIKLKQRYFKQNGGLLLEQQVSSGESNIQKTKLFVAEDLERATDNFNDNRILGRGGSGNVYKGMLSDGRIVAIKKSKVVDESQIGLFINELVILSQINHKNVVKLLGCCLETEVPLLAYEFISNGTLSHHLHDEDFRSSLSWETRLRIATELAGALAYLHYSTTIPIFHRDIKSCNILLDESCRAKISDFGISRSVPSEKTHLTTLVQGTFGYLDPEYFHSGQFTDKSDVYSFGVVLVELLTGQKPISSSKSEEEKNLIMQYVALISENRIFEILETRVLEEGDKEELLIVSKLAKRCIEYVGKDRPTMREVSIALEGLRKSQEQPCLAQNYREAKYDLHDSISFSMSTEESEETNLICYTI